MTLGEQGYKPNHLYDICLKENKTKREQIRTVCACTVLYSWPTVATNREGNQVAGG